MRRSSISSSERPPWAGIWAAILVIAIDLLLFSSWGPWKTLEQRALGRDLLAHGIARDRLQLRALAAVPEDTARVVVVGSSRTKAGFLPKPGEEPGRGPVPFHVAKLAHAGMNVFAIRSLADELVGYRPDVVVLLLSEFDTHAALDPRASASFGSFSAVVDLASAVGAELGFETRANFYRLALATLLDAYRYREAVEWAGARELRSFPMGPRGLEELRGSPPPGSSYPVGEASPLDSRRGWQLVEELERRFPATLLARLYWQREGVRGITRGDHVEIQMRLVRGAVRRLRAAGAEVIIVEGPVLALTAEYYDATIRDDFVTFARGLAREPGVHFVPLKLSAIYPEEEFTDFSHLNEAGARKLTAVILRAVRGVLEQRS